MNELARKLEKQVPTDCYSMFENNLHIFFGSNDVDKVAFSKKEMQSRGLIEEKAHGLYDQTFVWDGKPIFRVYLEYGNESASIHSEWN